MTQPGPIPLAREPQFSPATSPTLPSIALSQAERDLVSRLHRKAVRDRQFLELAECYYGGVQTLTNLGIAVPPELEFLKIVLGWAALAVDPYVERLVVEGFRLRGATDADDTLWDLWTDNGMPAEFPLAAIDARALGRGWFTVGTDPEGSDVPRIAVESPKNIVGEWDTYRRAWRAAYQAYWRDSQRCVALYLPDKTVHVTAVDGEDWQPFEVDDHGFGRVAVEMMPNRPRSHYRDGNSEITWPLRTLIDAACRKLLCLEVASEIYSVPQRYIAGALESNFQDAQGNPKTAWQTYLTRVLALEADENGNLPTVGQFQAYDPSVYATVIDMYAGQVAGITGALPADIGLFNEANPPSADAFEFSEGRRNRRALAMARTDGVALTRAMQLAMMFANKGTLPEQYRRIEVDWANPATLNLAATSDAMQKQVAAGIVSPQSDVVRKRLGYSATERAQLEQDQDVFEGDMLLQTVAAKLGGASDSAGKPAASSQPSA